MIFVSVGTDTFPFDRLLKEIDRLVGFKIITDDVFCQIGYSLYRPIHCNYVRFIEFNKINEYFKNADIIISHAGPASIIQALILGKIPIVIPRLKKFKEAVDDHQFLFTKKIANKKIILPVYNIDELKSHILNYNIEISNLKVESIKYIVEKNAIEFSEKLDLICTKLMEKI